MRRKILVLVGTYSEAILMAPLISHLRAEHGLRTTVCLTTPHRQVLDQALGIFGIHADDMRDSDSAIEEYKPDRVLAYGHTATSIESLRLHAPAATGKTALHMYELRYSAEAADGRAIKVLSTYFFVPSETSRDDLLGQGVSADKVALIGDLAVDALQMAIGRIRKDSALKAKLAAAFPFINSKSRRLVLVIGHRRANHGGGLEGVCRALRRLAMRADAQVAYPAPLNPQVRSVVDGLFAGHPNVTLIEPQDYLHSVYLMQAAYLILADSGDTPKEALSMGKPVLVMRDHAERPEVPDSGTIRLVGTDADRILRECSMFLDDPSYYRAFSTHHNPYGDGQASRRVVEKLLQ